MNFSNFKVYIIHLVKYRFHLMRLGCISVFPDKIPNDIVAASPWTIFQVQESSKILREWDKGCKFHWILRHPDVSIIQTTEAIGIRELPKIFSIHVKKTCQYRLRNLWYSFPSLITSFSLYDSTCMWLISNASCLSPSYLVHWNTVLIYLLIFNFFTFLYITFLFAILHISVKIISLKIRFVNVSAFRKVFNSSYYLQGKSKFLRFCARLFPNVFC